MLLHNYLSSVLLGKQAHEKVSLGLEAVRWLRTKLPWLPQSLGVRSSSLGSLSLWKRHTQAAALPVLLGEHRACQGICPGKQPVRLLALEEEGSAQDFGNRARLNVTLQQGKRGWIPRTADMGWVGNVGRLMYLF